MPSYIAPVIRKHGDTNLGQPEDRDRREAEAACIVLAHQTGAAYLAPRREAVARVLTGRGLSPAARKARQRALAQLPQEDRALFSEMRARLLPPTRGTDPLTALCLRLRDRAGLTAPEIARVLEAAGLEKQGSGAAMRVQRRIDRARLRAGAAPRTTRKTSAG